MLGGVSAVLLSARARLGGGRKRQRGAHASGAGAGGGTGNGIRNGTQNGDLGGAAAAATAVAAAEASGGLRRRRVRGPDGGGHDYAHWFAAGGGTVQQDRGPGEREGRSHFVPVLMYLDTDTSTEEGGGQ